MCEKLYFSLVNLPFFSIGIACGAGRTKEKNLKNAMNAEYAPRLNGGYREKLLVSQYRRMFDAFQAFKEGAPSDTILDVGATPTSLTGSLNYLPDWSDSQDRTPMTTSCEIDLSSHVNARYYRADKRKISQQAAGRKLPFEDGQFDWVYCNALIEHIGSFERQYELLKELTRVSRKGVFVTTANRWYPVEFNTRFPLLHWLPRGVWRRMLKMMGKGVWASESVLNPLSSKDLQKLASLLPGKPWSDIGHIRIFGVKAHFFLMIRKR